MFVTLLLRDEYSVVAINCNECLIWNGFTGNMKLL